MKILTYLRVKERQRAPIRWFIPQMTENRVINSDCPSGWQQPSELSHHLSVFQGSDKWESETKLRVNLRSSEIGIRSPNQYLRCFDKCLCQQQVYLGYGGKLDCKKRSSNFSRYSVKYFVTCRNTQSGSSQLSISSLISFTLLWKNVSSIFSNKTSSGIILIPITSSVISASHTLNLKFPFTHKKKRKHNLRSSLSICVVACF